MKNFPFIRWLTVVCGGLFLILGLILPGGSGVDEANAYAPPGSADGVPLATFHLWRINEIFSCADGSIQFIEFVTDSDFQEFLDSRELRATSLDGLQTESFFFPSNSGSPTANKSLLIATSGFGSLPGGVTPDFTIPANFLFTEGGSISLIDADTLNYGAGELPLDGVKSLSRGGGTGLNSPRNFAGQEGSISCPLVISKTGPATVTSGSLMTYTLTVTSSGPVDNTNVVLTDTIPDGVSFAFADVTPAGGVLTWTIGDMLAPLAVISRTFVVTVDAPAGVSVTNVDFGVRSDQSSARGLALQIPVVTDSDTSQFVYLPIIFKNAGVIDEHAADLPLDSLK